MFALKNRKDFKIIGKSVKNLENKKIITGKGIFGSDFYRRGMVAGNDPAAASIWYKDKIR